MVVRIDDILVTGKTRHDYLKHLKEVFARLDKGGIHLKLKKCFSTRRSGLSGTSHKPKWNSTGGR